MTKTQELLELAAHRLGTTTDYKLAQALGIDRRRISDYRAGTRHADAYAAAQIAMALQRDPLEVIAEIEAEAARSKPIRDFWRSFSSGRLLNVIVGGLLATSSFTGGALTAGTPKADSTSHNVRIRQRPTQKTTAPRGGFLLAVDLTHARRKSRSSATKSAWHSPR